MFPVILADFFQISFFRTSQQKSEESWSSTFSFFFVEYVPANHDGRHGDSVDDEKFTTLFKIARMSGACVDDARLVNR